MPKQIVVYFNHDSSENIAFFKDLRDIKSGAMAAIIYQGNSPYRVRFTGANPRIVKIAPPDTFHVNPNLVADVLGADLVGHLNLIDGFNFQDMTLTLIYGTKFEDNTNRTYARSGDLVFRNNNFILYLQSRHVLKVVETKTDKILWERKK